jgi:DNA-binding transcriptional LysR family regulator
MDGWSITGLRVAREVAAQGSFTAAAEALGYTQSAVSRQIAALEQAAGAPLFERQARGVRPTRAGRILLGHAAAILDRVEAASSELAGLEDRLAGRVAVGVFPSALAALVPRALARLRDAHPALTIALHEGGTPAHLRRLRAGRLQVATVAVGDGLDPYDLSGLRADPIFDGRLLLAVGAAHPFARRDRVDVAELEGVSWIVTGADGPQFDVWPSAPEPHHVAYAVRDWPGRLGLVAAGLGVAVVPQIMAAAMPPGVHLVAVDEPAPLRRSVLAVTATDPSPGAAAFVAALRAEADTLSA